MGIVSSGGGALVSPGQNAHVPDRGLLSPLQRSLPRQIDVTCSMPNANALQIGVAGTPPGMCQRMQ